MFVSFLIFNYKTNTGSLVIRKSINLINKAVNRGLPNLQLLNHKHLEVIPEGGTNV